MHQLLKNGPLPNRGELALPEFRRIADGLRQNVVRVLHYRRDNPMTVVNTHPLVKLLMSLNVPITLDPLIYNDKVRDVALYTARALGFTTALNEGRVFENGPFYGAGVTEVIWAHTDDWDTSLALTRWRELRPIRVLYHPKTDLGCQVPDGKSGEESGIAVLAINVPMLATQYRMWREEQRLTHATESQRSIMQFLAELPLPHMLYSHLEWAIFNRLMSRFFGVELGVIPPKHPFTLFNWANDVDRQLDRLLAHWNGKNLHFDDIVSQIPTVFHSDFHELMRLPELTFMRQVQWAVVLARLAPVTFLVQHNALTGNGANQMYLNYLRRYLTQMDVAGVMISALGRDRTRYRETMDLIDVGIRPYL